MKPASLIAVLFCLVSTSCLTSAVRANPCVSPPAGLVGWWPGEGNANDIIGTNNATLSATGASYAPAMVGMGFRLDGTNGYVQVPYTTVLEPSNLTLEAWVWLDPNANTNPCTECIVFKQNTWTAWFEGYGLAKTSLQNPDGSYSNHFQFTISRTGNQVGINSVTIVQRGVWYHVAATYDGNQSTLYVNGVAEASTVAGFPLDYGTEPVYFGTTGTWAPYLSMFAGIIDEPSIYNRALSSNEIAGLFAAGSAGKCSTACVQPPSGLVGWWKGDGNTVDAAAGNNGTGFNVNYTNGVVSEAFSFDPENLPYGSYTGVDVPDEPAYMLTNSLTIEGWVRPRGNGYEIFFRGDHRPGLDPYFLSMQANSNLDFYVTQADNTSASVGTTLNYYQWTHVAATLDGGTGTMSLYTNGVLASQLITTIRPFGALDPTQSPGIGIGNVNDGGNNFPFIGDIDEISLYNRALSATEVATLYNAGSAGKCANSNPLPVITLEPTNDAVNVGGTATFSVTANSTTPLYYQWNSNSVNVAGATNATLVLTNVQLNQSGTVYYVTVINSGGATNSTPATLTVTPPPSCDPTPSGIVGWWPGEGNANDIVAGNTGTLPNGGGYTNGEVGMAFNFNGGNQYLLVQPTNSALDVGQGNGLTIEGWINPDSLSSPEIIAEYERVLGSGSGSDVGVDFAINNNNTSNLPGAVAANIVDTNDASHLIASPGSLITAGTWQHVALTYDKVSGLGILYVNGVIVAQTNLGSFTPQTSFTNILTARTTFNSVASPNAAFTGGLDELSFYNRALSSNEIAAIYNAANTGKCPPPTPPAIVSQTPSQIVLVGNPVTLSVTATGSQPLNYFWSRNNGLIPNATNSSYTLSNPQLSDSGSKFSCLVSNAYGTAVSTNVSLKVLDTVSNDLCSGAVIITSYNYTNTQSTLNASSYGDPVPDCVGGFGNGVWYQFNAPVSGLLYVDTFGSDFDTGLAAYTGSCGSLTEVACNDDTLGVTSQVIVPATAGTTYYFLAGGYDGHVGNLVFHLNYLTPPVFVVQPTNLSVVVSSNAIFSPTLSGAQPMTFQWYFNSSPLVDGGRISGSTNSTLTVADVQTMDAGNYQLIASNFLGTATSSVAALTPVILPPVFTQPPTDQSVPAGSNVNFTAMVGGTPPFEYQWYFNGLPLTDDGVRIAGSTTSSLNISNLTLADAGNYSLVVTNVSGSVSAGAMLQVLAPPVFTTQPIGRSVPPGLPTTFITGASGVPTPNYQWQLNGTNIPGATSTYYTIASVGTNMLGFYQLVASNSLGTAVSAPAQLTFGPVAAWGLNSSQQCLPPPGLSNVVAMAGSYQSSFALRADGTIAAWGGGIYTNLFAGATNAVALSIGDDGFEGAVLRADGTVTGALPTPAGLTNIVAVSVGGARFGYALRAEGTLEGWGSIDYTNTPAGLSHIMAVACGFSHTVALRNDGSVFAWGIGSATNVPPGLTNIAAIAAGYSHSLALSSNGTVIAWGTGSGTVLPAGLTNIAAISIGYSGQGQSLNLAVRSNGTVVAWGDNPDGETNPPSALTNLTTVAVAAGVFHGLALVNDGNPYILRPPVGLTAYAGRNVTLQGLAVGAAPLSYQWLQNGTNIPGATNTSLVIPNIQTNNAGYYQLLVSNSLNTALSLPAPVNVISNSTLTFLSQPSGFQTNFQGSKVSFGVTVLGAGPLSYQWYFSTNSKPLIALPAATNDTLILDPALAIQSGYYSCTVSNMSSQSPYLSTITSSLIYQRVLFAKAWGALATDPPFNLTNATAVAVGNYGTGASPADYLALSAAGKISSWNNGFQQPYYGETNFSALSNSIVTAIAAGYGDTLALKSDGTVFAAGLGQYGVTNVPAAANGITAIACGDYHDLALRYDGIVVGWGQNLYGQATNSAATNIVAIAAGGLSSIALRADGTVITWGMNGNELPNYPYGPSVSNTVAVACGNGFFLALHTNGTVTAWGNTSYGQTTIPANWTNIVAISAGANHSTALRNDGRVLSLGFESGISQYASNNVPANLANVIAIASSGDRDLALFGTRAPAFTVQPWSRTVYTTNTSVWFCGKCAGVQPIHYQWQLDGTNLPSATNDTLTLGNRSLFPPTFPHTNDLVPGIYQLIVSNAYGVVASKYAQLTVLIPLGTALNATNLNWTTGGDAAWFGETNVTHDGVSAVQSGDIGPAQESDLYTIVGTNYSGNYSFWWKVSSELDFDFLEFRVNGIVQTNISGEVNWQQVSIHVPAGTNQLEWRYYKTSPFAGGLDAGWVDQFAYVADPPLITRQPVSQVVHVGTNVVLSVEATGVSFGYAGSLSRLTYQWHQNGNVIGYNSPSLVLNNVGRAQDGSYYVTVTDLSTGESTVSSNATLLVLVPQLLGTPALLPDGSFQLTSGDMNGGQIPAAALTNFEAQVSTNLINWVTLPNGLTLTNGTLLLQDGSPANGPERFYRIIEH